MLCLQLGGVEGRLQELDHSSKELTDHKFRSEATIRELQVKLGSSEEVCHCLSPPSFLPSLSPPFLPPSPLSFPRSLLFSYSYSARLRQALGIGPTSLPPYIPRMCLLGYPPGYRLQAEDKGLLMYDTPETGTIITVIQISQKRSESNLGIQSRYSTKKFEIWISSY